MYCTQCGEPRNQNDKFCKSCGASLDEDVTVPEASDQAPREELTQASLEPEAAATQEKNGLATAALVLGLVSVFLFEFVFIPLAAVTVSSFALNKSLKLNSAGVEKPGTGKSVTGLVLGLIYLILSFVYMAGLNP